MATRRSSARRIARPARRKLVWARQAVDTTFASAAPFVPFQLDLLSGFTARWGADALGVTIARIRGFIGVASTVAGGVPTTVGVRVGSEGEVASTEFNPMTNGEYLDWMLYEPFHGLLDGTSPFSGTDICARVVDVKSMRKLEELDQTLFLLAGTDSAVAATITLRYNLSVLLMLP